jgi:predicted NBD/HSP70 family sugar kinase
MLKRAKHWLAGVRVDHAKRVIERARVPVPAVAERKILVVEVMAVMIAAIAAAVRARAHAVAIVGAPIAEQIASPPAMINLDDAFFGRRNWVIGGR